MMNPGTALRIAARSDEGVPEAPASAAGLITSDVGALHAQWRRTLETMKVTLAGLEEACDSAIEARNTEAAGLIDTLVRRVETERDEQQRECRLQVAAAEAQSEALRTEVQAHKIEISTLREQLDAAIAERAKLQETFRLVQRALALGTAEHIVLPAADEGRGASVIAMPAPVQPSGPGAEPADHAPTAETVAVDPQSAIMDAHPDVAQDITRVLDQVEAMYQLDLDSGRSGIEIVDSLTASIRSARSLVATRWNSPGLDAQALFEYQIGLMLERQTGTAFGRHLGIAAYASRTPA